MASQYNLQMTASPGTIHEAAQALNHSDTTSVAICQSLIARSAAVDARINGFVALDHDAVMKAAEASDRRRAAGNALSPYDGVPVAVKDNISVTGQGCGCASKILSGYHATYDATVIDRLRNAGFVCFGRTNMDEFAMGSSTEHSACGPTRNPWDTRCVPGGSSGGSAAVVASGQAIAAIGSDTGGSIRQPAGFCGVVGLKPTYGRVSRYGLVAFASSLDQIGPITNDVRDAAILLEVIGGHDPRDTTSLPDNCGGFHKALDNVSIRDITVGVPREFFDVDGLTPEVRSAVESAVGMYRDAGCRIVDVEIPHLKYAIAAYYIIATAEASSNLARFDGIRYGARAGDGDDLLTAYLQTRKNGFGAEVKRRIILGTFVLSSGYYDAYYLRAQKIRTLIRNDFEHALAQCDVIISPVTPAPAFKLGSVTTPLEMYLSDIYTVPVNLAGICAISIPASADGRALPVGVQLIGASMAEVPLLQAAHWYHSQREEHAS